jgi:hypothetical protein
MDPSRMSGLGPTPDVPASAFPPLVEAKRTSVGEYERSRFMSSHPGQERGGKRGGGLAPLRLLRKVLAL